MRSFHQSGNFNEHLLCLKQLILNRAFNVKWQLFWVSVASGSSTICGFQMALPTLQRKWSCCTVFCNVFKLSSNCIIILHPLSSQCQRLIPSPVSGLHLLPTSQGPPSCMSCPPLGLTLLSTFNHAQMFIIFGIQIKPLSILSLSSVGPIGNTVSFYLPPAQA